MKMLPEVSSSWLSTHYGVVLFPTSVGLVQPLVGLVQPLEIEGLKVENKHLKSKLRRALLRNAFLSIKEQCGEKSGYSYAMKAEELHATPACS
jgi:hypothetical protein